MEANESEAQGAFGTLIGALAPYWWLVVAGWAVLAYVVTYLLLPGAVPAPVYTYVAQPLLWLGLAGVAFLGWRHALDERPGITEPLLRAALVVGAVQIALLVAAGLLFGFGRSPYGHGALSSLSNLWYVGAALIGMEVSRAYLVAALGRHRPLLALVLVCLFCSALSIPLARFETLQGPPAFETAGGLILPALSENLLATFLAALGGPLASLTYRGLLKAFEWFSPLLPDLGWMAAALLGTLVPALGLLFAYRQSQPEPAIESEEPSREAQPLFAWLLVSLVAVALLWLNTGLFGVQPTLVASGSMVPALRVGDVVITRDVPIDEVKVRDIVRYRQGGSDVIHRVVEVRTDGDERTLITRGDDNNVDDPPVSAGQLKGKVILTIPKVGWVAIAFRRVVEWIR